MEGLPPTTAIGGLCLVAFGGWALAAYFIRLFFTGKVYVAAQVDREMAAAAMALERAEHDRDEWRAEGRIKDTQIALKDEQLRFMGEVGKTQEAVLSTLQRLARGEELS